MCVYNVKYMIILVFILYLYVVEARL